MLEWLRAPALYDAILALLVVEGLALLWYHRRTGRGLRPVQLISFLGAGAGFTVACRALAAGWSAWIIAAALSSALVCHVVYLRVSDSAPRAF